MPFHPFKDRKKWYTLILKGNSCRQLNRHTGEKHIHELAISCTRTQFFHFTIRCLQAVIDPGQHLMSGEILIGHRCVVYIHCHFPERSKIHISNQYFLLDLQIHMMIGAVTKCRLLFFLKKIKKTRWSDDSFDLYGKILIDHWDFYFSVWAIGPFKEMDCWMR